MKNRRKQTRIRERNPVLIKSSSSLDFGAGINAYTVDISLDGARIFSQEYFDVGTIIRLKVELARSKQSITLDAEVKWLALREEENLFELGVEFQPEVSQTILALIGHLYGQSARVPSSISLKKAPERAPTL